jgi:CubicO group peptidase (beta-lactamase class C family)
MSRGPGREAWEHVDPADVGLDPGALDRAAESLAAAGERQGLVVIRGGRIAFERYWANEFHRAEPTWQNVSFSLGKSWGPTLVGRAVTLGHLSVEDLVAPFHPPEESGLHPDVTVRHLLTMSSGGTLMVKPSTRRPRRLGEEKRPAPPGDEYQRMEVGERGSPEGYGVSIPPGDRFYYDGAPADHLSNVVAAAVGTTAHEFMMTEVVRRLGCENFEYQAQGVDLAGNVRIGGSLLLSCRDAARVGQLYLDRGCWAGEQLIAEEYVAGATAPSPLNPDFGWLWWLNGAERGPAAPTSMFFGAGARGQFCFVLPDHDVVIATMGFGTETLSAADAWNELAAILPR